MKQIPLLFLSDSPSEPTGLGRITKDLAVLCSSLPQFRVGVMGRSAGMLGSRHLPFKEYPFDQTHQWGEEHIEQVWDDFAGSREGIVMTIWDLSRLHWFSRPRMNGRLQEFLESKKFRKWAYVPVDSYGVGGKLTGLSADTLLGFDRVLAYGMFGKDVLEYTLQREVDWIPHGYSAKVFSRKEKTPGRAMLKVAEDEQLIGCVMTNQARKDWGACFATWARVKKQGRRFWAHVDVLARYWDLRALAVDFGLDKDVIVTFTGDYTAEELSYLYSACDMTMLPSLGEGFGYPIVESLACGVPVLHTHYGGGAELIPEPNWLVGVDVTRLDGLWNCVRPVLNPVKWAEKVEWVLANDCYEGMSERCVRSVEHLEWNKLWPSAWKKWFMEGISDSKGID